MFTAVRGPRTMAKWLITKITVVAPGFTPGMLHTPKDEQKKPLQTDQGQAPHCNRRQPVLTFLEKTLEQVFTDPTLLYHLTENPFRKGGKAPSQSAALEGKAGKLEESAAVHGKRLGKLKHPMVSRSRF